MWCSEEYLVLKTENIVLGGSGLTMHSNPHLELEYLREDNELRRVLQAGGGDWYPRYLTEVARRSGWDMEKWEKVMAEELVDLDADLENADWLRGRTWDIWHEGRLVETLPDLLTVVGKDRLPQFMQLPAAEAMPASLRVAVEKYLAKE